MVIFYIIISLLGYFSTFEETPEVFVERIAPWGTDILMIIAQIIITICLIFSIMFNYVPFRTAVYGILFSNPEVTIKR